MFLDDDDMSAAETAVSYTDEFLDAAVARIDAVFGAGHAQANPALVAGYIQACASNLGAFMTAAAQMQGSGLSEMLSAAMEDAALEEEMHMTAKAPKSRGKGKR